MKKILFYQLLILLCLSALLYPQNGNLTSAVINWKEKGFHATIADFPEGYEAQLDADLDNFKKRSFPLFNYNFPLDALEILQSREISEDPVLDFFKKQITDYNFIMFINVNDENPPTLENPWFLVVHFAVDPNKDLDDTNIFNTIKNYFSVPPLDHKFFPHITIGQITTINDEHKFYETLKEANNAFQTYIKEKNPRIRIDRNHLHFRHTNPKSKTKQSILINTISKKSEVMKSIQFIKDKLIEIDSKSGSKKRITIEQPASSSGSTSVSSSERSSPKNILIDLLKSLETQLKRLLSILS